MTTLARTRAETLFASMTARADRAVEPSVLPLQNTVELRQAGPNTLHLPIDTPSTRVGWLVTKPRRVLKATVAGGSW